MKLSVVLAIASLVGACAVGDGSVTDGPYLPDRSEIPEVITEPGSVVVQPGDVFDVAWDTITVEVVEILDGRCPSVWDPDVVCVWEGEVSTTLAVHFDDGSTETVVLTGVHAGDGETVYGQRHWAQISLTEISAAGIDLDGRVTLWIGGLD